jgi:hypothetical protein
MQYRSPSGSDRTVTAFIAANEDVLLQGMGELIKPEIWNALQGNVVIWNKGAESVSWQKVGSDYHIGAVSVPVRMEFYFSKYPWFWIITLLVIAALLAFITTRLLIGFRRKNHPKAGK